MEFITNLNSALNSFIWGPIMLVLLVGTGIYLTIRNKCIQAGKFGHMWKNTIGTLFKKDKSTTKSDGKNVSAFAAVSTALASTVGVGNVAGVAGAIAAGGPGAVFWMWISAFFGMCTKYAEIVLAVKYRQTGKDGTYYGGPMYYMKNGFKNKGLGNALGWIFALLAGFACFGIGDATQSAEISKAISNLFGFGGSETAALVIAIILAVFVGVVIIGGLKSISTVTSYLVPFMAIFYIVGALAVIILNISSLPTALGIIFKEAFSFEAIGGGIFGYAIFLAMQKGVARGVFSNEAGLGSAPIAHAASSTKDPVKQGLWGIFEVFVDTIVICTLTGLTVVMSGIYETSSATGGELTAECFDSMLPGIGGIVVRVGLMLFALSTILGWEYYGETCWGYISKENKAVKFIFRVVYVVVCFVGAFTAASSSEGLKLAWDIADTLNGFMALPNLIALLVLSPVVIAATKKYFLTGSSLDK